MKRWIPPVAAVVALSVVTLIWNSVPIPALPSENAPEVSARVSVACPQLSTTAEDTYLAAVSKGEVRVSPLNGADVPKVGQQVVLQEQSEPLRVQANRSHSFGASVWGAHSSGADQGLAAAVCVAPASQFWFPGVRSHKNAVAEVVLVNLDRQEAVVDLTVYTAKGQEFPQGSRGIGVQPGATRTVSLSAMLDNGEPVTIKVALSSSRVAAFVRQRLFAGKQGTQIAGTEWISPSPSPEPVVVIPGVPSKISGATLVVTNPGERATSAGVELIGSFGSAAIAGADALDLPAQTTRTLQLPQAFTDEIAAIRVTSTQALSVSLLADTTKELASNDPAVVVSTAVLPQNAAFFVPVAASAQLSLVNVGSKPAEVSILSGKDEKPEKVVVPAGATAAVEVATKQTILLQSNSESLQAAVVASKKVGKIQGLTVLPVVGEDSLRIDYTIGYDPRVGS
ncbi:MAG: DUF5719 family protein [Propionibacteriaceae bacterium]|nr:DUF5719 family protein [Propionibacteriaceae bacterium]